MQAKQKYRARYSNGKVRDIYANNLAHAAMIAKGIAKTNKWKINSVGRI